MSSYLAMEDQHRSWYRTVRQEVGRQAVN